MNIASTYKTLIFILVMSFIGTGFPKTVQAQGGHGPVFTLATPTLGQGEFNYDIMGMSVRGKQTAWMLRQNWHYGVTEDFQLNLSIPTTLQKINNPPQARLGTMMGTYGDIEASTMIRFFKTYPGVGKRFESTLLLSGTAPTEDRRSGLRVGPSLHSGIVTGYASRTIYMWVGGGYQYYTQKHGDQLGSITYLTGVIGYRPPLFQHDYPKPDWRIFAESVTEWVGNSRIGGQKLNGTKGIKTMLGPSVLGLYGKWGLSAGILFPVYTDFADDSNTEDFRLSMVLSYWF